MGTPRKITTPSFFTGNEVIDVFLPLMQPDCLAVYQFLRCKEYMNPELRHTVRQIAGLIKRSPGIVSRSLEVLEHLRLAKLARFGGSKESKCKLLDSKEAALGFGAILNSRTLSWSLPAEKLNGLQIEISTIRQRQQGKRSQEADATARIRGGNRRVRVSQRNAGVSLEKRQRAARETQTGTHLIREEKRSKEVLSPTPSLSIDAQNSNESPEKSKDSPDEDEPESPLKWATAVFTGVMNDFGDHLLETSRPPAPHLANGAEDWSSFGFGSLAVAAAEWRGEALALTLSVGDPEVAKRGLYKYRKKWEASVRAWYECEVSIELVQAQR